MLMTCLIVLYFRFILIFTLRKVCCLCTLDWGSCFFLNYPFWWTCFVEGCWRRIGTDRFEISRMYALNFHPLWTNEEEARDFWSTLPLLLFLIMQGPCTTAFVVLNRRRSVQCSWNSLFCNTYWLHVMSKASYPTSLYQPTMNTL